MFCRQPILTLYAYFGLSYFYYDVVVMFIGTYLEEKQEDPQRDLYYIWTKFFKKKKLIVFHHLLLPLVGFPAITVSNDTYYYIFIDWVEGPHGKNIWLDITMCRPQHTLSMHHDLQPNIFPCTFSEYFYRFCCILMSM